MRLREGGDTWLEPSAPSVRLEDVYPLICLEATPHIPPSRLRTFLTPSCPHPHLYGSHESHSVILSQ